MPTPSNEPNFKQVRGIPTSAVGRLTVVCAALILASSHAIGVSLTGLVAFGDSLSDLGNTTATVPDSLSGYNSYYYDQGRWSNGPLWVEHLNDSLGFTPLQRNSGSGPVGTDFAYGGSTSGTGSTFFLLPNLQFQVGKYAALLSGGPSSLPDVSTTLFTVWSGGNDIIYHIDSGYSLTPQQIATNISTAVTSLYNQGGRYFLVPNLPPLGEKPNYLFNRSKHEQADEFVSTYNPLLEQTLAGLRSTLAGATIISLDIYTLVFDAIDHPGNYGLTNVTDPAFTANSSAPNGGTVVANPDEYLFWDETHPTSTSHEFIGLFAYQAVMAAVPEPATVVLIGFAGVFFLAYSRRCRQSAPRINAPGPGRPARGGR